MNIHREKDFPLYQDMAVRVSEQSYAKRKQVGCIILAKTGMLSLGFNGMPSGYPNQCEISGVTDPLVIHAERNAIDKMTREGVSPYGSIVFVTLSPCLECAKSLAAVGVSAVYYRDLHRQEAIDHLNQMGIITKEWRLND
jgi:dCMP deaminase